MFFGARRLKLPGMRWAHEGASRILDLRTILLSGTWTSTLGASVKVNVALLRTYATNTSMNAEIAA